MKLKVIDSFLDDAYFAVLQQEVLSSDFPWFFSSSINGLGEYEFVPEKPLLDFQFTHIVYANSQPQSSIWPLVQPVLERLGASTLLRIKFNLNPVWPENVQLGFHDDSTKKLLSAILYMNDNNGKTYFSDGSEVEPLANRAVIFDSRLLHAGATTTNEKRRVVLNIVWNPIDSTWNF